MQHLGQFALLVRALMIHHRDLVGQISDQRDIWCDEQVAQPKIVVQPLEQIRDLRLQRYTKNTGRLITDDDLGIGCERLWDADSLALAAGEVARIAEAWFLPSAEEEYRQGVVALRVYLVSLVQGTDQTARFYARADNLSAYLAVVEKRLGSYGQRLTASVGDPKLTAALTPFGGAGAQLLDGTSWDQIDNVFFDARGYSWALLHMMKALSVDFARVTR